MVGFVTEKIDEIEARTNRIKNRLLDDPTRYQFIREFSEDLVTKARQGATHLKQLKWNYTLFTFGHQIWRSIQEKNKMKSLDSYEAITSKVKAMNDNLNSLILSLYLNDSMIETYRSRFENKGPGNIHPGNFDQVSPLLPQIDGKSLFGVVSDQYKKFSPFFEIHRNTTQHGKTGASLEHKMGWFTHELIMPAHTVSTEQEEDVNLKNGLDEIFNSYLDHTLNILRVVSNDAISAKFAEDKHMDLRVQKIVDSNLVRRTIKKAVYSVGVLSMLATPTYFIIDGIEKKNRLEKEKNILHSMYDAQEKKNIVNISDLVTFENTKELMESFIQEIKFNDEIVEGDKAFFSRARLSMRLFYGDDKAEYVALIKRINSFRDSLDSRLRNVVDSRWKQGPSLMGENWRNDVRKSYLESYETLDSLMENKFDLELQATKKVYDGYFQLNSFEDEFEAGTDIILQDLYVALIMAKYAQGNGGRVMTLRKETIYQELTKPETLFALSENYHKTIMGIAKKLDGGVEGFVEGFLLNNTPYFKHLTLLSLNNKYEINDDYFSQELSSARLNEDIGDVAGAAMGVRRDLAGMEERSINAQYKVLSWRKLYQAPLDAITLPYLDAEIDTIEVHNMMEYDRAEDIIFFKRYAPGKRTDDKSLQSKK